MATGDRPQPDASRLGNVPPPCEEHARLQQRRSCHLQSTLGLGKEEASAKRQTLAHAKILRTTWWPLVVLLRIEAETRWDEGDRVALPCDLSAVSSVHQGQARLKPIPSGMGDVLRETRRQAHDPHPCGSCNPALPVANARRKVPCLRSYDHSGDRMA